MSFYAYHSKYLCLHTAKSPVFTQIYSAVIGLTTLRAHRCQSFFQRDFDRYQDVHSSAWFFFMASSRWLGVYMDCIVVTYVASITYACVLFGESIIFNPSLNTILKWQDNIYIFLTNKA